MSGFPLNQRLKSALKRTMYVAVASFSFSASEADQGEADPLLVVTDGAPGLIAGADRIDAGDIDAGETLAHRIEGTGSLMTLRQSVATVAPKWGR